MLDKIGSTNSSVKGGNITLEKTINYSLVFIILITIVFMIGSAGFYVLYAIENARLTTVKNDYSKSQKELNTPKMKELENKIDVISTQVDLLDKSLRDKVYWKRLLDELKRITRKSVQFSTLSVDEKGKARLDGQTDSYSSVARQMVAFMKSDKFTNVTLQSTTQALTDNKIVTNFSLSLDLALDKLKEIK